MPWLLRSDDVLCSLEVASTRAERRRGLIGRPGLIGALLLERTRWVHTLGVRFPIDVAYLDGDGTVIKICRMSRFRIGMPVPRARRVVEAPAGTFARWELAEGDQLEVRFP
jgi:uncharacterized membrane protein (UPF0127 family)